MSEVEVVRGALRHAAKALDRRLQGFDAAGSLDAVRSQGAVSAQHLGGWDAGQTFAVTTDQAYSSLVKGYEDFLDEYQNAVAALLRVADAYDKAEDMTAEKVRSVMVGIEG